MDSNNFKTDLDGSFSLLIKDQSPDKKVRQIKIAPSTDFKISIVVRYSVTATFTNVVVGTKPKQTRKSGPKDFKLPTLYKEELPLLNTLQKDLLALCSNNAILSQFHEYCQGLTSTGEVENSDDK